MSVADVVVLIAACVACTGAVVSVVAAGVLVGQVRRLERGIEALRGEAVPLVHEARRAAEDAASQMERVDAVLVDTGSVTAAVDSAARITQRAFANPIVKVLAWRAGAAGALVRLRAPDGRDGRPSPGLRKRTGPAVRSAVPAPGHSGAEPGPVLARAAGRGRRSHEPVASRR
jgi:hypothetical protein